MVPTGSAANTLGTDTDGWMYAVHWRSDNNYAGNLSALLLHNDKVYTLTEPHVFLVVNLEIFQCLDRKGTLTVYVDGMCR